MTTTIDLIIPVFNRLEYTKACLYSIYAVDHGAQVRPVIIDNGSRSRTANFIKEWAKAYDSPDMDISPSVEKPFIITLPGNYGFSGAVNHWIKNVECSSKIAIAHNDTIFFPNWLGEILQCSEEYDDDEIAVWMPRTNYANESCLCIPDVRNRFNEIKPPNKERLEYRNVLEIFLETYSDTHDKWITANYEEQSFRDELFTLSSIYNDKGVSEFLTKTREATSVSYNDIGEQKFKSNPRASYSPEISCFCMVTDTKYFKEYGLFDEEFFPRGFEDKLWFLKMEREGLCCHIANCSVVHHFGNITSDGPGFSYPDVMRINEERYKKKVDELNKIGRKA